MRAATPPSADHTRILERLKGIDREAAMLGVTNSPVEAEHLEAVYQWLHGKQFDMKELGQSALSSVRSMVVEKQLGACPRIKKRPQAVDLGPSQ